MKNLIFFYSVKTSAADTHPIYGPSSLPFHVIVKPIGPVCNLSCTYCYYLPKNKLYPGIKNFRMPDDILENFTRQYIQSQPEGVQEIQFSWQGGEPTLLGLPFFKRAVELQKKYTRPGMTILNTLQTNGTRLDDAWGKFFHAESFLIGISIDGPEKVHDRFRLSPDGRGSHREVMRGLEILHRHAVEFNTLTVVNRLNGDQPLATYDFLKETGSRFFQFIPIVEREQSGVVTPESVGSRQWGRFLKGIFERWREADVGEIFVQLFDVFLGLYMGLPSSLCAHAETCGRAVALEHNGDLYSCDHFVFRPYLLGNLKNTPVSSLLDGDFQKEFGEKKRSALPLICRNCRYLPLCHGGCPAHRFRTAPGGEQGLNYLCEGYKLFFQNTLPYLRAMAACLRQGSPAKEYHRCLEPQTSGPTAPGRNSPCPCGSGEKYKNCCEN